MAGDEITSSQGQARRIARRYAAREFTTGIRGQ